LDYSLYPEAEQNSLAVTASVTLWLKKILPFLTLVVRRVGGRNRPWLNAMLKGKMVIAHVSLFMRVKPATFRLTHTVGFN